jgi:hypothetical protein
MKLLMMRFSQPSFTSFLLGPNILSTSFSNTPQSVQIFSSAPRSQTLPNLSEYSPQHLVLKHSPICPNILLSTSFSNTPNPSKYSPQHLVLKHSRICPNILLSTSFSNTPNLSKDSLQHFVLKHPPICPNILRSTSFSNTPQSV